MSLDVAYPTTWANAPRSDAIYFLHIEKTGGTSVHKILTELFHGTPICPAHLGDEIANADIEALLQYRLFSGHFTGAFTEFLGAPLRTITLLRDPVQRSISHYAHIRRDPSAAQYSLAQGLSLREFCLHPETRPLIQDYQTRCLAGEVRDTPDRRVAPAPLPRSAEEQAQLLSRARETLASCAAVGATEHLAATLAAFCGTLGIAWSGAAPYENPSYNRPKTVDRETLSVIREITQADTILYQEAVRRLSAQAPEAAGQAGSARTNGGWPGAMGTSVPGAATPAKPAWPEREHRIKLGLSAAICTLPRTLRLAFALPYTMYRLLVDRTVSRFSRLPLLLGIAYLAAPLHLLSPRLQIPGYWDEAAAVALGFLLSALLSGKKKMTELKMAAVSRFDLQRRGQPIQDPGQPDAASG